MTTANRRKMQVTVLLILGSFLCVHLCFRLLPGVFATWNARTVDQLFVMRSSLERLRPFYDNTVVHVDLTNTSIQQLDNQYLDRSHFAKAVNNLAKMNVSVQVYDFIFAARKNPGNDQALITAVEHAGNVFFGMAFNLSSPREIDKPAHGHSKEASYLEKTKWHVAVEGNSGLFYTGLNPLITFPELAYASQGLGSLSINFDPDGVLRRVPLLVKYADAYYPTLPLKAACDYLQVPSEKILIKSGKEIVLQAARKPGDAAAHDIVIPIDPRGNMIVNYIGSWERMDHYNFVDILLAADDRDELNMWGQELGGKIVIVSDVSTGSTDIGPVPTDPAFPFSGIQANVIHNILTESFLRELSATEMFLIEVLLLIIVLGMSLRFSSFYFSLGTLLLASFYMATVAACFLYAQTILHIVRPLLMVALALLAIVVYRYIHEEREKLEGLRQRDFIRATFGRYLSNEVVEELLGSPDGLKMSGEIREVTFLVSDLRGFTALSSELSPHEVISTLNRYLESMVEIIGRYRGTVNEFQGDGLLAFFGAPIKSADDPQRAIACAIEMQNALADINAAQRQSNLPEFSMGIGINTGEVVIGNIGSEKRAKYGAVGSPINMVFRVESYSVGGQILICPDTFAQVEKEVRIRDSKKVNFKGIDHPIRLYDISGIEGKFKLSLAQKAPETLTMLQTPMPINCFPLEGKIVTEKGVTGSIIRLGTYTAEVILQKPIENHTNLKVLLTSPDASGLPGIYAKTASSYPTEPGALNTKTILQFTWLPQGVKQFLAGFHP